MAKLISVAVMSAVKNINTIHAVIVNYIENIISRTDMAA